MKRKWLLFFVLIFSLMIIISSSFALTAANVIPPSGLSDTVFPVLASQLAPSECDSIRNNLETVVVCTGGNCNGSNQNELILGTTGPDRINGKNGEDCIVGAAGDDDLNGGNDDDVLLGGPGDDVLDGGRKKDYDICYGGGGADTFDNCDTIY
ncbi:MAG: hypothetical protein Kow002_07420 [Anaerolineales bacterium]